MKDVKDINETFIQIKDEVNFKEILWKGYKTKTKTERKEQKLINKLRRRSGCY